ncbi:DUF4352 domain-containing protein [Exiguobacterium sp. PHA03]|uniref:DUF4352 domain-containing protein n=1 Tax=Exiguobacterium sp. PHA03 TaxID=3064895 RepID=UPI0035C1E567
MDEEFYREEREERKRKEKAKLNQRRMNGVLLAIVFIIFGVAISNQDDNQVVEDPKSDQVEAEGAKDDGVKIENVGQPVKLNNLTITVEGSEERTYLEGADETQGKIVLVQVTVQNDDNEARTIDDSMFQLTAGGKTYEADTTLSRYANDGSSLFFDKINPGLSLTANIAYEVPQNLSGYDVLVEGGVGTEAGEQTLIKLN